MRFGPIVREYLVNIIIESGINNVLEIGTLVGHTSIFMAANLPENGSVHTIEVDLESAKLASQNIEMANLSHKIKLYIGDALEIIPGIETKFDMLFIDAKKSNYCEYLKASEHLLELNAVIVADNVKRFSSEMDSFLQYVRNSEKYISNYYDLGFDGIEISKKISL